jgi:protease-4
MSDAQELDGYKKMVEKLAFAAIKEQRVKRRWRTFFLLLTFIYLTPMFVIMLDSVDDNWFSSDETSAKHIAKVELSGAIMAGTSSSAENIIQSLRNAYENENSLAIVLEINSPGGSPVQSSYIYNEIIRLRDKNPDRPFYVVVEDIAASGGYFVASAGEIILVNESSAVGSIGVRLDSFGAVELMSKLGVERRLITAGEHKGLLDPFMPVNSDQMSNIHALLDDSHQHFIKSVKAGRGDRLQNHPDLYTGLMWSGASAKKLGLVDDFGSTLSVARQFNTDNIKNFSVKGNIVERFTNRLGATLQASISHFIYGSVY